MADRFALCAEYLDACYEAWKAVFDNYDTLLRTFRSLTPNMTEELVEMLKDLKRQIEEKKGELESTFETNLQRFQAGANVQETQPLAFKFNFNFSKILKTAWPTTPTPVAPLPQPQNLMGFPAPPVLGPIAPPVPFHQPQIQQQVQIPLHIPVQPSAPPGFDLFGGQDRVLSWVNQSAPPVKSQHHQKPLPPPPPPIVASVAPQPQTLILDDDDFETFGNGGGNGVEVDDFDEPPPLAEPVRQIRNCDLDDFDTFGPDGTAPLPPPPPVRPISAPGHMKASAQASQTSSQGGSSQQGGPPTLPPGDPATVLETMRCIDFLTNKIKQKYGGEQQQAPLTKVYGHLSQEEGYRAIIGGGVDFPDFLSKFPDYFRLTGDRAAVFLTKAACEKSNQAVKMAEKQLSDWQKSQKKQPIVAKKTPDSTVQASIKPSKKASPQSNLVAKGGANMKPSLMDMDEYGDSNSGSSVGGGGGGGGGDHILDDDEFDEFGGGGNENAKPPTVQMVTQPQSRQPVITMQPTVQPRAVSSSGNHQPLTYWEIVEMIVKRLDLAKTFETYDVGKQVAVEAVKFAMQAHDMATNFGQMDQDLIANIVKDFIPKGAESVKRKQQAQRAEDSSLTPGVTEKQLAEWKHKTILCSDYAANSQCPRGGSCSFAHGKNDLRPRRRVKLCSSYNAGTCRKSAEECANAHGSDWLGTVMPGQEHLLVNIPAAAAPPPPVSTAAPKANLAPAPAPSKSYWKGTSSTAASGSTNFQDTDQSCSICLDSMRDSATSRLPCGHRFHKHCFLAWKAKGQSTCPKCRIAIVDEAEFPSLN